MKSKEGLIAMGLAAMISDEKKDDVLTFKNHRAIDYFDYSPSYYGKTGTIKTKPKKKRKRNKAARKSRKRNRN